MLHTERFVESFNSPTVSTLKLPGCRYEPHLGRNLKLLWQKHFYYDNYIVKNKRHSQNHQTVMQNLVPVSFFLSFLFCSPSFAQKEKKPLHLFRDSILRTLFPSLHSEMVLNGSFGANEILHSFILVYKNMVKNT